MQALRCEGFARFLVKGRRDKGKPADGNLSLLSALKQERDLEKVKAIHATVVERKWESNLYLANTLIDAYGKCGCMLDARDVFDAMCRRDAVSWNALMFGYAENGEGHTALEMFASMLSDGVPPTALTIVAALKACNAVAQKEKQIPSTSGSFGDMQQKGKIIHSVAAANNLDTDIRVVSALLDLYTKSRDLTMAERIFDVCQDHNVVSWTSMVLGYEGNGHGSISLQLFALMDRQGIEPNSVTFCAVLKACASLSERDSSVAIQRARAVHAQAAQTVDFNAFLSSSLIDVYAKCNRMLDAKRVFDILGARNDVVSWTSLIFGYAENGEAKLALELYHKMVCEPDARTFAAVLKACGSLALLSAGEAIHDNVRRRGLDSHELVTGSLVDFYGKCGAMSEAQKVFDSIPGVANIVTWNSLISGYSRQGRVQVVLDLVERMRSCRLRANAATLLFVLSACSHAGAVEQGKQCFEAMYSKFGVPPQLEHYHCMIDILCRANELENAFALVTKMPFKPTAVTWNTLLDASHRWKNATIAKLAFDALLGHGEAEAVPRCFSMWLGAQANQDR